MARATPWCYGGDGAYVCGNPPIPAGTPARHTRILGRNYEHCNTDNGPDKSKMTQIFGGHGVFAALNLRDAQYVDVQCMEITRHSQCIVHGSPAYPSPCKTGFPLDDYDSNGVVTDVGTRDVLLQDLWIHGHTDRGILGPIGGLVTANRVVIGYNGDSGWDFDDGRGTASVNATLVFNYSTIEWSGCKPGSTRSFMLILLFPATARARAGMATGSAARQTWAWTCISITRSSAITRRTARISGISTRARTRCVSPTRSAMQQWRAVEVGPQLYIGGGREQSDPGNCLRMSAPIAGAPGSYNAHLEDSAGPDRLCPSTSARAARRCWPITPIVSYAPITADINCWASICSQSTLTFENNILRGYDNPGTYMLGGEAGGPSGLYFGKPIGNVVRNGNIYFG